LRVLRAAQSNFSRRYRTTGLAGSEASHTSHPRKIAGEILVSRSRFALPTVTPGSIPGAFRFASWSCISFCGLTVRLSASEAFAIGQKAAQDRFSEEVSEPLRSLRNAFLESSVAGHTYDGGVQQAWMNSRNLTNIATGSEHRQPDFWHPTEKSVRRCAGLQDYALPRSRRSKA